MKTLTQLSEENGATVMGEFDRCILPEGSIVHNSEAQLLATFKAWSAQQEPIAYLRFYSHEYLVNPDFGMDAHEGFEVCEKTDLSVDGTPAFPVYTAKEPQ